jgi:hypothetical protein
MFMKLCFDCACALSVFGCPPLLCALLCWPAAARDLKAENVLMLPDGTWVLCDYGSATIR